MLVYVCLLWQVLTLAASGGSDPPEWAAPNAMAIRRVSPVTSAQSEPNFLDNLDCSLVTYRLAATSTMQTGCFTEAAFGLIDSDNGIVIFNGTDEGLPLLAHAPHQVLAPWPRALNMISLDAVSTGGSYISLYKNPLAVIQDQRNFLGQLTAKRLTAPPDLPLTDKAKQRLVINAQTLAFSDGGSWLVAETLGGSFVRINLASLDLKAFAPAFGAQGSPALLKSRVAVSDDGRYVAIASDAAKSFKVYDLTACGGTSVNLQPESCPSYDYRPLAERQIAGLQSIRHVRFINEGLLSFEARTSNPASGGIYALAPTGSINSLIDYLGMGDSYTSGEGAFNYLADTDSTNNMCHLSARSYPLLLTRDLFSARGGHSVACSGAVIKDVGSTNQNYRGQVRNVLDFAHLKQSNPALLNSVMTNFVPGYVAQQRFVKQYQPGVTTVSVGGDDIGFGDIVERCVMPRVSWHLSDNTCFNTYEDRLELTRLIDRTIPRWLALYKQLKASAPGTRLYAIGYPSIASDTGNCGLNVHLDKSELEFSEELIAYLNGAIQKAASQAGVVYVDISQALVGYRLCETASFNVAVNGLTAGKDAGVLGIKVFGKESYHPNALGQQLVEQAILKQTRNLTSSVPADNSDNGAQKLLKAPKTGRIVRTRVPDPTLTPRLVKPGKTAVVKASGSRNGLKPKTSYTVRLDDPSGPVVGSGISNDEGDLDITIDMPTDTTPGSHTVDVTGENQAGEPVDVTQPIYVPASDTDADGDGLPNATDSCPAAGNSGADDDQDGVDDVCDNFIDSPPNSTDIPGNVSLPPVAGTTNSINTSPGSGSSTQPLPPAIITEVTAFRADSRDATPSIARVLGAATVNPVNRQSSALTNPIHAKPNSYRIERRQIHTFNWWLWIILAVIVWLLLVIIGLYVDNFVERRSRVAYI